MMKNHEMEQPLVEGTQVVFCHICQRELSGVFHTHVQAEQAKAKHSRETGHAKVFQSIQPKVEKTRL